MANWIGAVLTEKGRNLHAKVETGEVLLTITKMKIGDGILPAGKSLEKLTDLISPRKNLGVVTKEYMGDGLCKISSPLTNEDVEEGYYLRELGLFANDPDEGDILYAVTMDSNPDYLPAKTSQTSIFKDLNMYIAISNAESIEVKVDLEGTLSVKNAGIIIDDKISKHDVSDNAHEKKFNGYVKSVVEKDGTVTVTKGDTSAGSFTVTPRSHMADENAHKDLLEELLKEKVNHADFTQSFSENGWTKFPNGLILQWGRNNAPTVNTTLSINFPIKFPNTCLTISIVDISQKILPPIMMRKVK